MTDPIAFQSVAARNALPLLFAGQAQKDAVLNEALLRLDVAMHCSVAGERNDPPEAAEEGDCWIVGSEPSGTWAERGGSVACFAGGDWLFLQPYPGFRCFNAATGQFVLFRSAWIAPDRPATPVGGTTVDMEARESIAAILNTLTVAGIFRA